MFELIYQSYCAHDFSPEDLIELCQDAQKKNKKLQITGCLIHVNGEFAQILEGREQDVLELYQTIQHDNRHHGVFLIYQGPVKNRSFSDWSMSLQHYEDIATFNNDPELALRPLDSLTVIKSDASFARKMFDQFSRKALRNS